MRVGLFLPLVATAALQHQSLTRRELAALASSFGVSSASLPAFAATAGTAIKPFSQQTGFKLNTGVQFPTASFGLQIYDDDTAYKLTRIALEVGYRNFFASVLARNQRGFAKAVRDSKIPREDLFVCGSVLSNRAQGYDAAFRSSKQGCDQNLEAFAAGGLDYIDQIMLDYPGPDSDSIKGQWAALEQMAAEKTTRSISVSNFSPAQLDALLEVKRATVPAVNQLAYGVGFNEYYGGRAAEVVAENAKRGVLVQAWSPLQRALHTPKAKAACAEIGRKYDKTAAQVALRWIQDTGCTYTTAATTKLEGAERRFRENIEIFDFALSKDEIATLAKL